MGDAPFGPWPDIGSPPSIKAGAPCALRLGPTIGVMSTMVTLPDDLAGRVARLAAEGGVSVDEVVAQVLAAHLADTGTHPSPRRLAFAGIGASTSGRTAAQADEMLAEGFGRD